MNSVNGRGRRDLVARGMLAALLEQDRTMQAALAGVTRRIASALTFTQAERSLIRARVAQRISAPEERAAIRWLQQFGRRCDRIAVTDGILARAGRPFPAEPVHTMDAISPRWSCSARLLNS